MTCDVHFQVELTALADDKTVCLTGDAPELGQWSLSRVISMSRHDGVAINQSRWSIVVTLPRDREVNYRYAICSFHGNSDSVRVHHWESARVSRSLLTQGDKMTANGGNFGTIDGVSKVERGWLTTHSEFRLMVHSNPFTPAAGCGVSAYSIHISVSSQDDMGSRQLAGAEQGSPSKRMKQGCNTEPVLIRVLNSKEYQPHEQQPGGRLITSEDYFIYSVQSMKPGSVVFTIDLYSNDKSNGPILLGKSWLLGSNVKSDASEDQVLPVLLGTQIVGVLSVRSVVIHPLSPSSLCNMEVSYSSHWKWNRATLEGSHRGFGRSHQDSSLLQDIPVYSHVPENTIRAFQKGAVHGADFVEFDVNVTKDLVPIVYHDCEAKLSTKDTSKDGSAPLKLPFWAMTLDQLRSLRKGYPFVVEEVLPYHSKQGESPILSEADWPEEIRPFPELQQVLQSLPIHCAANIEVKYPMIMEDKAKESEFPPPDRNTIVDTILNVVLRHGGTRRIFFSAFDPEICTMLHLKQNKYPVNYLNYGRTDKYMCYKDPRSNTVTNAMWFALSEEMAGLVCHNDDIIRDPSILKAANDQGLVVFVWGEDNNRPDLVKSLKDMGVQGIIHDRVSLNPENSPNIFLQEKGAQRNLVVT